MKYVLDASVAIKLGVVEPDSARAQALASDHAAGIIELIAPDIFPAEICHGLLRAERRGVISDASARIDDILAIAPVFHAYLPLLGRAVELARSLRLGFYDCVYVALAEQEGCQLVTADLRLVTAVPAHCIDLATI